jgi:hypothetical protein
MRFTLIIFVFENRAVYKIMWKNTVEPEKPRMTIWRMCFACILDNHSYKHILRICNTYCFSTATVSVRTGLNVLLNVNCLPCNKINITGMKKRW